MNDEPCWIEITVPSGEQQAVFRQSKEVYENLFPRDVAEEWSQVLLQDKLDIGVQRQLQDLVERRLGDVVTVPFESRALAELLPDLRVALCERISEHLTAAPPPDTQGRELLKVIQCIRG